MSRYQVMSQKAKASAVATSATEASDLFKRAMKYRAQWPDNDELLDVIYWLRQVMGAILGVIWGLLPLYGFVGLLGFVLLSTTIVHFYVAVFQHADVEDLGGFWEVAKEGFMSSFATFLVTWIICYDALRHFEQ